MCVLVTSSRGFSLPVLGAHDVNDMILFINCGRGVWLRPPHNIFFSQAVFYTYVLWFQLYAIMALGCVSRWFWAFM